MEELIIKDDTYTLTIYVNKFFPAPKYRLNKLLKLARYNAQLYHRIIQLQGDAENAKANRSRKTN